jgi:cell division septation protein DedD
MKLKARLHSHTHNIQAARSWRTRRSCQPTIAVRGQPLKRSTLPVTLSRVITTIPANTTQPTQQTQRPSKHTETPDNNHNTFKPSAETGLTWISALASLDSHHQVTADQGRVHNNTILPKSSTATLPQPLPT